MMRGASLNRGMRGEHLSLQDLEKNVARAVDGRVKLFMYSAPPGFNRSLELDYVRYRRSSHMTWKLEYALWNLIPRHIYTNDPEEADFFIVPNALMGHFGSWTQYLSSLLAPMLRHILNDHPYFNRSGGRDHLFVYSGDTGPMCDCNLATLLLKEHAFMDSMVGSMLRIGYYGHRGPHSTTVENRTNANCGWRDGEDIAMPMFNEYHKRPPAMPWPAALRSSIVADVHFRGSVWGPTKPLTCMTVQGAVTYACSIGIRYWLQRYMTRECQLPALPWPALQLPANLKLSANRSTPRCSFQSGDVTRGLYNFCPAAHACWSARFFDSIDRGHIPVVLADGIVQPFEELLDYDHFSVTLDTEPLMRNELQTIRGLHSHAESVVQACSATPDAPECTQLEPVQMMIRTHQVASYFAYAPNSNRSAWGMLMPELCCRKYKRLRGIPPPAWKHIPCTFCGPS